MANKRSLWEAISVTTSWAIPWITKVCEGKDGIFFNYITPELIKISFMYANTTSGLTDITES